MVQREEMYFEPRCVGSDLRIRWYGEQYSAPELERHYEERFTSGTAEKS